MPRVAPPLQSLQLDAACQRVAGAVFKTTTNKQKNVPPRFSEFRSCVKVEVAWRNHTESSSARILKAAVKLSTKRDLAVPKAARSLRRAASQSPQSRWHQHKAGPARARARAHTHTHTHTHTDTHTHTHARARARARTAAAHARARTHDTHGHHHHHHYHHHQNKNETMTKLRRDPRVSDFFLLFFCFFNHKHFIIAVDLSSG